MEKKQNQGNKPKPRETHQIQEENNDTTPKRNTHRNGPRRGMNHEFRKKNKAFFDRF